MSTLFLSFPLSEARDFSRPCSTAVALLWHRCCTAPGRLQSLHSSKYVLVQFLLFKLGWLCMCIDSFNMKFIDGSAHFPYSVCHAVLKIYAGDCVNLPFTFTSYFVASCIKPCLQCTCTSSGMLLHEKEKETLTPGGPCGGLRILLLSYHACLPSAPQFHFTFF